MEENNVFEATNVTEVCNQNDNSQADNCDCRGGISPIVKGVTILATLTAAAVIVGRKVMKKKGAKKANNDEVMATAEEVSDENGKTEAEKSEN